MDNFNNFLKKLATPSAILLTYTAFAARDLEFYIQGNVISFEKDPFLFGLILLLFALIPLVLIVGSLLLYIGCNSSKNGWLSRRSGEIAENYEKSRKESEEYNS